MGSSRLPVYCKLPNLLLQLRALCNPGQQRDVVDCRWKREAEHPATLGGWLGAHKHRLHSFTEYLLLCVWYCARGFWSWEQEKGALAFTQTISKRNLQHYISKIHMRKFVLSLHKVAQLKSGGFRIWLELCLTCVHARAHTSRCIPLRAQKPPGNSQITAVCWGLQLVIWTVLSKSY